MKSLKQLLMLIIAFGALCLLVATAASVQLDDWLSVILYGITAVLCVSAYFKLRIWSLR